MLRKPKVWGTIDFDSKTKLMTTLESVVGIAKILWIQIISKQKCNISLSSEDFSAAAQLINEKGICIITVFDTLLFFIPTVGLLVKLENEFIRKQYIRKRSKVRET